MSTSDAKLGDTQILVSPLIYLRSKSGRAYIGCDIPAESVETYIWQMAAEEAHDFDALRKNQVKRDRGSFHVTAISPPEFEKVGHNFSSDFIGKPITLVFSGLGKAVEDGHRSLFIVAQSEQLAELRKTLGLGVRDFHVTLGFDQEDVRNASKDRSTLVRKLPRE